jgi:hypothetical protein
MLGTGGPDAEYEALSCADAGLLDTAAVRIAELRPALLEESHRERDILLLGLREVVPPGAELVGVLNVP